MLLFYFSISSPSSSSRPLSFNFIWDAWQSKGSKTPNIIFYHNNLRSNHVLLFGALHHSWPKRVKKKLNNTNYTVPMEMTEIGQQQHSHGSMDGMVFGFWLVGASNCTKTRKAGARQKWQMGAASADLHGMAIFNTVNMLG